MKMDRTESEGSTTNASMHQHVFPDENSPEQRPHLVQQKSVATQTSCAKPEYYEKVSATLMKHASLMRMTLDKLD
jgi:hypothetical protein